MTENSERLARRRLAEGTLSVKALNENARRGRLRTSFRSITSYELISQLLVSNELKYIKSRPEVDGLIVHCRNIIDELNSLNKTIEGKSRAKS